MCGCSRQDGLGRSPENKIFCPLSGRDGQDRLAKRHGHRFWEGCAGYCVGNLGDLLSKRQDGGDGLGIRGRAQRTGRMWRGKRGWRAFGQGWTRGNGISVNAAGGNYGTFGEWRG